MGPKRGKIWILIGIIIIVSSIIVFNVFRGQDFTPQNNNLPSCGDKKELFSYYPVDLGIVERVTPQGEFGSSGGHVFPVKHVYAFDRYSPTSYSMEINRPKTEMVAPADMLITKIERYWDKNRGDEYYVHFSPCKEIYGAFFHMSDISPKLKQEFEKNKGAKEDTQDRGAAVFETVGGYVNIEVKAGEPIGFASVKSTQLFDFNLIDTRVPELQFANKGRFAKHRAFDLLHEACPYDYFIPEIKAALYPKISGYFDPDKKRTAQPLCGEYMQDIPDTAQGVWFRKGTANGEQGDENIIEREVLHIALAHEAYDPQRPILSAGQIEGLEPILYFIEPRSEGTINRDWKDIRSDGKTYCSDLIFDDNNLTPAGKSIILQMPTPTTLELEAIDSPCGNSKWSFTERAAEFER